MNLVEQIFEQAKLGTAPDPNANPFAEGMRMGLQQQQIDAEKQRLAMEIAQMPLKQALLQQEGALAKARTQVLLDERQAKANAAEAYAGLYAQVRPLMESGKIDDAQNKIISAGASNAFLLADPEKRLHGLFDMTTKAQDAKLALIKAKNESQDFTPHAALVPSAVAGQPPYEAVQVGPHSFTLPQSSVNTITTPEGLVIEQRTGAGGAPAGAGANGLNQAVATQLEEKLSNTSRASALLDESLSLISPENIGPRGKIGAAIETAANIIAPGSMPMPITKAQTTFNTTAQAQYNSLKADSQINKMEAAAMAKIANITDWWKAAQGAKEQYQTLRDLTGLQAVITSHKLNRITPDDILRGMSLDFVEKYRKQGTIKNAEMARWIDLHGGNDAVERMILEGK